MSEVAASPVPPGVMLAVTTSLEALRWESIAFGNVGRWCWLSSAPFALSRSMVMILCPDAT